MTTTGQVLESNQVNFDTLCAYPCTPVSPGGCKCNENLTKIAMLGQPDRSRTFQPALSYCVAFLKGVVYGTILVGGNRDTYKSVDKLLLLLTKLVENLCPNSVLASVVCSVCSRLKMNSFRVTTMEP